MVIRYPELIYLKKKENQVKIPSIYFKKHYNTKASTQTEYFFEKLFEPSSFRSETEHVFFSYVVKENQLFLKPGLKPRKKIIKNRVKKYCSV